MKEIEENYEKIDIDTFLNKYNGQRMLKLKTRLDTRIEVF